MLYLYIIQCKNCSAVLYCGIVLGRIWTYKCGEKAVQFVFFSLPAKKIPTVENLIKMQTDYYTIQTLTAGAFRFRCCTFFNLNADLYRPKHKSSTSGPIN